MSIEKKSLISNNTITKKANVGSKTTTGSPLVSNRMASKAVSQKLAGKATLDFRRASKATLDVKRASKK